MLKSSLVKWAVAAALAVPAVPLFGSTHHHHKVVMSSRSRHNVALMAAPASHHNKTTTTRHHTTKLAHGKKTPTKLTAKHSTKYTSSHRGHVKTTASTSHVRHTSLSSGTTSSHFKVHVTKMPPTIDGIPA